MRGMKIMLSFHLSLNSWASSIKHWIKALRVNYNDTIAYDVCEYESSVVVWLDETASQYFDSLGIPLLSVNIGNVQIPSAIATENFYSEVECLDTNIGLIHYVYKWEDSLTTSVIFTVIDGTNSIMFQSTEFVLANGCVKLLLTREKIEEYLTASGL